MSFQTITPISAVAVAAGATNTPVNVELEDPMGEMQQGVE